MRIKYPCIVCNKSVKNNQNAMLCIICEKWCHLKCSNECMDLFSSDNDWICQKCIFHELPFADEYDMIEKNVTATSLLSADVCIPTNALPSIQFKNMESCKGMKIAHLNCLSLLKNIDEIR